MSSSIGKRSRPRIGTAALEIASSVFECIDTPVSLGVSLRLKYGEIDDLVNLSIDPLDYVDPASFFLDLQAVKLLSKFPFKGRRDLCRRKAIESFIDAERICQETNRVMRLRENSQFAFTGIVESVLLRSTRIIANILGPVPELESLDFRFGPGANLGVRGDTSHFKKLTSALECTYAFSSFLPEFLGEFPGWTSPGSYTVKLVEGSELTFVPKNAKTDRPICIEPLLNGLYQKGFGAYIRDRLRAFGVNLRDQTINQACAQKAHSSGLCTVDFSSASDTIAYSVVQDLLPIDWFEALDRGRSPNFSFEGLWYPLQKFSSMGNAYTFELESLLFFAVARASCEALDVPYRVGESLHVYGDDVIIPEPAFDLFSQVSEAIGFKINRSKSFTSGLFYESCGADFFGGYFVRPIQFDEELKQLPHHFYAINSVLEIALALDRLPRWEGVQVSRVLSRLRRLYRNLVGGIPRHLRAVGPRNDESPLGFRAGVADSFITVPLDVAMPHIRRHRFWCGWVAHGFRLSSRFVDLKGHEHITQAYALYSAGSGVEIDRFGHRIIGDASPSLGYSLRVTEGCRKVSFFHHKWPEPLFTDYGVRTFASSEMFVKAQ